MARHFCLWFWPFGTTVSCGQNSHTISPILWSLWISWKIFSSKHIKQKYVIALHNCKTQRGNFLRLTDKHTIKAINLATTANNVAKEEKKIQIWRPFWQLRCQSQCEVDKCWAQLKLKCQNFKNFTFQKLKYLVCLSLICHLQQNIWNF